MVKEVKILGPPSVCRWHRNENQTTMSFRTSLLGALRLGWLFDDTPRTQPIRNAVHFETHLTNVLNGRLYILYENSGHVPPCY